ncbi:mobilome CxxCx(11)CxxC protein [Sinorhizobium sp. CCBAU 05631]|uniref:mobilome CxxCx(11)CxxC protein n=1 Tax=Sinorhizobium sp. CCBAU 05631 TaxID=794846 RepID=UPI000A001B1A|nr:mobilome CxxCx(11)CxxC protein [Sinorhizobium sp. CCBAU 05631]
MIPEAEMRTQAWNSALNCHGTYIVFSRRLRRLKLLTKLRDFWAFAIPIILGGIAGSDAFGLPATYLTVLKIGLAVAAVIQLLFALWAVFSRWDDDLAYSSRAVRDSYEMEQAWRAIGEGRVNDIALEFRMRTDQQKIIDSHDIEKDITSEEKNLGMRNGLIEYRRSCAVCNEIPTSRRLPWWPKKKCAVCGGN